MNIQLNLSEEETAIIETLLNEELGTLEEALFWADEYQDYDEYETLEVEYEFLNEIIVDMQLQLVEQEVFV